MHKRFSPSRNTTCKIEPLESRRMLASATGFNINHVAGSITLGTAMAFAPDGRLFVCTQDGHLRVIKNGALLGTDFLTLTVDSNGERGCLGVAFDPNFAGNRFIYCYYTVPGVNGAPSHNRVSRFTASSANPD